MSIAERVEQRLDPHPPGPAVALVPLAADRGRGVELAKPRGPGPGAGMRVTAHVFWYGGLALFVAGAWQEPRDRFPEVWFVFGVLFLGLGGLVGLIYTFWRVGEAKLRQALAALAVLALTIAAGPRVSDVSREVYAGSLIPRMAPLAEALAHDGRIWYLAFSQTWEALNGYNGPSVPHPAYDARDTAAGRASTSLDDVLRRDGITRAELDAYRRRFASAGADVADVAPGWVVLHPAGTNDLRMLYVAPGHVLPSRGTLGAQYSRWRSGPMGGGWYVLHAD